MLILLPPKYPRRPRRKVRTDSVAPPAPLQVLSTETVFDSDAIYVFATFNTTEESPLNGVESADTVKWNARYDGQRFTGQALTLMAYNVIRVGLFVPTSDPGDDELNYTNNP